LIFWSDHGYQFGEKQRFAKRSLWRRSSRVLFTLKAPGITKPDVSCDQPVSLVDIYPTLLDLCQLPNPGHPLDGISLRPQLNNAEVSRRPAVITHEIGNDAVCDARWTYIRYKDGGEELYDRNADENEWHNLAQDKQYRSKMDSLLQWTPENLGIRIRPVTGK